MTSCTTKTTLTYHPSLQEQPQNHISVAVDDFQDTRMNPQRIGSLRNTYGNALVKIITDDDVPIWMKDALEEELKNAGYTIVNEEQEDGLCIKGKILKLSSGTYFKYTGKIIMEMSLIQGDKILLEKQYACKKDTGVCLQLSPLINSKKQAVKCSDALDNSLQGVYRQFIEDVNQLLLSSSCRDS